MDSDSRLTHITFKASDTEDSKISIAVALVNSHFKKIKSETRYYSSGEMQKVSKAQREAINKILGVKKYNKHRWSS
jgi:hypothetical protein